MEVIWGESVVPQKFCTKLICTTTPPEKKFLFKNTYLSILIHFFVNVLMTFFSALLLKMRPKIGRDRYHITDFLSSFNHI